MTVFGDTKYEADELVRVELTGVTGGVLDTNPSNYRKTVTITNDDQPAGALVSFKPGSVSAAEGNSGSTLVPVTVQLSAVSAAPVTVRYSVVEQPLLSTAATPGEDFRGESGSVTIAAGQTEGTFNVTVFGDTNGSCGGSTDRRGRCARPPCLGSRRIDHRYIGRASYMTSRRRPPSVPGSRIRPARQSCGCRLRTGRSRREVGETPARRGSCHATAGRCPRGGSGA